MLSTTLEDVAGTNSLEGSKVSSDEDQEDQEGSDQTELLVLVADSEDQLSVGLATGVAVVESKLVVGLCKLYDSGMVGEHVPSPFGLVLRPISAPPNETEGHLLGRARSRASGHVAVIQITGVLSIARIVVALRPEYGVDLVTCPACQVGIWRKPISPAYIRYSSRCPANILQKGSAKTVETYSGHNVGNATALRGPIGEAN
jgi:hypothetical protein